MDWNDYIALAENLATSTGEAEKRSSVGRAYYALYNVAKEWLCKDPKRRNLIPPRGENSHKSLWEEIGKFKPEGNKIAQTGQLLRTRRTECDYDKILKDQTIIRNPQLSINLAKDAIKKVGNLEN